MSVNNMHALSMWKSEEDIRSPGMEVMYDC